jgi:kynurenine formamidase
MTESGVSSEAAELFRSCCNWDRWGNDDQLGTLNYITPEVTLAAMGEVRLGRTVSLARTLDARHSTPGAAGPIELHMLYAEGPDPITCGELISLRVHGMDKTHSDALGHEFWSGQAYGGRRASEIITRGGLAAGDTLAQAGGVVTRGVLLDVCAVRGVRWLEPGEGISAADLEAAEGLAGTRLRAGDAAVVHAGSDRRRAAGVPDDPSGVREGLLPECLRLLHERQVAVFAADCIERLPSNLPDMPFPLHQVGITGMGLMLVDSVRADRLVDACAEAGRSTCLFVVSPLPIRGGTGSPVNPLCIL